MMQQMPHYNKPDAFTVTGLLLATPDWARHIGIKAVKQRFCA
jgi:hypothetical protein